MGKIDEIRDLLAGEADHLLGFADPRISAGAAARSGAGLGRPHLRALRQAGAGPAQPGGPLRPRAPGGYRLSLHPPGGPGHRALGGRLLRPQPHLLRPGEHRAPGHRGGLQRRRLHPGGPGQRGPQVRPPHPLHPQDQPQRAAHLPQHIRPGHVRRRAAGLRYGSGGRRRHHLLRLAREFPPDRRGERGLLAGPRDGHGHHPLVLPAQRRLQGRRQGLLRRFRPHRPGRPPRGHHRGGHHQAEAAGDWTGATGRSTRAAPGSASTAS